jgi:hypothetical protein
MQRCYVDSVVDTAGNALANAQVYVYLAGTSTPAAIYSDNGITPILPTGQTTTNSIGQLSFYAADGRYDLKAVKTGYTDIWYRDVLFDDPITWIEAGQWIDARSYGVVGDGVTDDSAALSNAINSNPGKIVVIPAGFNCRMLTMVTITAANVTVFANRATFTQATTATDNAMFWPAATGITFDGGTFIGNGNLLKAIRNTPGVSDGLTLRGCEFSGFQVAALIERTSNVLVERCYFHNNSGVVLAVWDISNAGNASDIRILNNRFEGNTATDQSAIWVGTSSATYDYKNVLVSGNRVVHTVPSTSAAVCCTMRRCTGGKAIGNYFEAGSMGVSIDNSSDALADGNNCIGNYYYGIEVAGGTYGACNNVTVTGNVVDMKGLGLTGIAIQGTVASTDCAVVGNTITDPKNQGVFLYEYWNYASITGNTFNLTASGGSTQRGIHVYGHSLTTNVITNVTIDGNTFKGSANFDYGVEIRSANYVTIGRNNFKSFNIGGVLLNGTFDTIDWVDISGNTFSDTGGVTTEVSWTGTLGDHVVIGPNPGYRYANCDAQIVMNANANQFMGWGATGPEGLVTAGVGSFFFDRLHGVGHVKETGAGNTGWKYMMIEASGTTANRPTTNLFIGRPYFDTTLGKPIAIKSLGPTVWVDGVGTVV